MVPGADIQRTAGLGPSWRRHGHAAGSRRKSFWTGVGLNSVSLAPCDIQSNYPCGTYTGHPASTSACHPTNTGHPACTYHPTGTGHATSTNSDASRCVTRTNSTARTNSCYPTSFSPVACDSLDARVAVNSHNPCLAPRTFPTGTNTRTFPATCSGTTTCSGTRTFPGTHTRT